MKVCAFKIGDLSTRDLLLIDGFKIDLKDVALLPNFLDYQEGKMRLPYLSKFLYSFYIFRLILSKIKSFDTVLILQQVFIAKWLGYLASRLAMKRVILDVYVSDFDVRINDRKSLRRGTFGSLALITKERLMLKGSTHSFFLSKTDMYYILQVLKLEETQVNAFILPLCVDVVRVDSNNRRLNTNKLWLAWWGTFNKIHGLDLIFNSLSMLQSKHGVDFHLDVFGVNVLKGKPYEELIENLNLEGRVTIHYDKSFSDGSLYEVLGSKSYDLTFGLFGDMIKAKSVISNKLVESLALGLPHLQVESVALGDFEGLESCVYTCKAIPQSIVEVLLSFKFMGYTEKVDNGYILYQKYFSKDAFLNRLELFNENIIHSYR